MIELTCPAEEGIAAAQIRKEARYAGLAQINATSWKARLLTLEVGAQGLVGSRTYRAFRILGLSSHQTKTLVKGLSEVVARCSYAIYLAHSSPVWTHNDDLVSASSLPKSVPRPSANIVVLRNHGIKHLYHFTDSNNLNSIRETGLMSATRLQEKSIVSKMNSDETSRNIDRNSGLEDFVRLSFCSNNPMMYVSKKEGRINNPVVLKVKLEVVSRPGVLFTDCNATHRDAQIGKDPTLYALTLPK